MAGTRSALPGLLRRMQAAAVALLLAVAVMGATHDRDQGGGGGTTAGVEWQAAAGMPEGLSVSVSDVDAVPADPTGASLLLARLAFPDGASTVLLARDDAFADALAGGVLQAGAPLLLVPGDRRLPAAVHGELDRLGATSALVLGGEAAIGRAVVDDLAGRDMAVRRLAGDTRLVTAQRIAAYAAGIESAGDGAAEDDARGPKPGNGNGGGGGPDRPAEESTEPEPAPDPSSEPDPVEAVLLTRAFGDAGDETRAFADSLAAGALAADAGWPVLLTDTGELSPEARDGVLALDPGEVVLVGGEAAISAAVAEEVAGLGFAVRRLAGSTRVETSQAVHDEREAQHSGSATADRAVVLDAGDPSAWVTGFTSAALAARTGAPVVLTAGPALSAEGAAALAAARPTRLLCAVDPGVCEQARRAAGLPAGLLPTFSTAPSMALPAGGELTLPAGEDLAGPVDARGTCLADERAISPAGDELVLPVTSEAPSGACTVALTAELEGGVVQHIDATFTVLTVHQDLLAASSDYATEVLGDPWDYRNVEDILLDHGPTIQVSDARVADGVVSFTSDGGYVHLLWPVYPGAIPIGRDGAVVPIDGDRFEEVVVRVHSSVSGSASLAWQTCPGLPGECDRSTGSLSLQAGWQTLRVRPGWSGPVYGLRFGTGGRADIAIDDVRVITAPGPSVAVSGTDGPLTVSASDTAETTDPTRLPTVPVIDGRADLSALPGGRYTLTAPGGTSVAVTLVEPPRLRILDPDVTGGEDYITAATGDPWDFSQPSDVGHLGNATAASFDGGVLRATNTSDDPYVDVRMGAVGLDPNHHHRVTVTFGNEGPLDLGYDPGGGSHGRLLWRHVGGVGGDSEEIVAYPHYRTYTFSMHAPGTAEAGLASWLGAPIEQIRFDPNEDPGPRRWWVEDLAIRADDASPGTFQVRLADVTPAPLRDLPTTVTVGLDTDRQGFDGVVVARDVALGRETGVPISTCGLAPGSYWVHAAAARGPATTAVYASGPLQVANSSC